MDFRTVAQPTYLSALATMPNHCSAGCNFWPAISVGQTETQWNLQPSPTMTPKKTILRELSRNYDPSGVAAHVRPATIIGFSAEPEKFQKAVNELLRARLIEGRKDEEGHMAIALNAQRMDDVRRHLRPAWAHPAVWATVIVVGAVGAGLVL